MATDKDPAFKKAAIIGVGLIGASFALALREKGLCGNISGNGRKEENLRRAKERGILDSYSLDAREACEDADLIILATPAGAFKGIAEDIRGIIAKGALVTDAGSVKGQLCYDLDSLMPGGVYYVGSHPIAGSDKSGIDDARADLFRNAKCIITPTENSDGKAIKHIISIWESFGAKTEAIDPFRHDEIYATVSHLPHLIAYALVNTVDDIDAGYISYAGQGFKDSTRIALSSPELWRDISMLNRDNLLKVIGLFRQNLDRVEKLIETSDHPGIEKEFLRARALREKLK